MGRPTTIQLELSRYEAGKLAQEVLDWLRAFPTERFLTVVLDRLESAPPYRTP
jgi:hypothetical protein